MKQFAVLKGKPLWVHSAKAFERCPDITSYIIVTNRSRVAAVRREAERQVLGKLTTIVPGGAERSDSVANGLAVLPVKGLVAIHDAARPLLTPEMLNEGIRACRRFRAVTFGHPVTDTLKRAKGNRISATVDRAGLIAVQTPQFFDLALLRRAYDSARDAGIKATDDCALVERLGVKPAWLPGPRTNIKVTLPEDLRVCAALQ